MINENMPLFTLLTVNNNHKKHLMKNKKLMLLLCAMTLGAWLCPLHADTGPQKKLTRDAYVIWDPQILEPSQLSSNSDAGSAESSSLSYLIDNDASTVFHSVWHTDMKLADETVEKWLAALATITGVTNTDPGYHNLQVRLNEPVTEFRFEYKGRNNDTYHDNPNHIAIYATNDQIVAQNTSNSNQDQWEFITELTPENTDFPGNELVIGEAWQSPVITMPEAFRYLRFVILGTTNENQTAERTFAAPDVTGITWNCSEFQIYVPREATDPADILQNLVDSVQTVWSSYKFEIGTDPGYVDEKKYTAAYAMWEEASDALLDNLASEEYTDYINRLRAAITEFMTTGINQVETGYYNIVNTNPQFMTLQGTTMSMYVNSQKQLGWTKSDSLNAAQLWYIEKLDSARYSIKNVASGEYIGSVKGQSMFVPMAPAHVTDQIIEWLPQYPGQFNIYNVENAYDYCINGHGDGTGTGGRIDTWDGTGNSNSAWLFRHVTDQELIDKLVAEGPQAIMASAMNLALDSANASRNKANEYTKLITRAEQINSNANDPASGSFANLIDNNTGTIFHSMWSDAFKSPTELGTSYGWHNLQFTLDEPVSSIRFDFTARVTSDGWIDTPNHITLYATNDDALGASTAAADSSKWVEIVDMTKEEYNFPIHQSGAVYNSPIIDLGGDYKYLRFVVKHTTGVEPGNNRAGGFVSPQATGITFNLSEFQIYDSTPTEKSQYYTVPGMKEACDALEVLYEQYSGYTESDINSGTPVEELTAALVKLQDAYVDTTAVCSLYNAYKEITAREIYEGDLPGDVDDYTAVGTFDAVLDEARALIDPKRPTKKQVNSATDKITTGYDEFMSHVILPQPYVWYVIRSGVTSESYPYAVNQPIFLDNVSVGGSLRIGGYEIGNEYQDVYDIWRLVPVESNEPVAEGEEIKPWEQTFAIQSLGTGQYWGKYRGQGTANGPQMESEPTPYHIYFYGNGCFALQQEGVKDPFDRIKADGTDLMICNYPANSGDQQSWKFDEVNLSGDGTTHINWYPATSIAIVTFPWAIADGDLQSYRPDIETYSVNSIITNEGAEGDEPSYTLTLTAKQEFAAGEPFIMITNDAENADANDNSPLYFWLPEEAPEAITDTSAVDYNGLVGTLQGLTINGQASLYFENSMLNVATDAGYTIPGRSGYIDVTKVKDLGGPIDKTITINGIINDIKNVEIVETENEIVDVYTIDGVLIKRNIKAAEATRNLTKGIYIVGKKKVLVK